MWARRRSPSAQRSSRTELFTREQLDALHEAESGADPEERERLYRLRKTCESGLVEVELSAREDELENAILAARVVYRGRSCRSGRPRRSSLSSTHSRSARSSASSTATPPPASTTSGWRCCRRERSDAELSGEKDAVARNEEEKGISLRELSQVLTEASRAADEVYGRLSGKWFDKLLDEGRPEVPSSYHVAWLRRLSPLESTYTKERATQVCLQTLRHLGFNMDEEPNIRMDLDDRPQKSPRACVIAADPPKVVHLITRAQGGLHDYQAFLHEAGHALHYGNRDPNLPYTFRTSRDHALTEIYSYIFEAISREPGWHVEHFGSPRRRRRRTPRRRSSSRRFYRRYTAKLQFESSSGADSATGPPARPGTTIC